MGVDPAACSFNEGIMCRFWFIATFTLNLVTAFFISWSDRTSAPIRRDADSTLSAFLVKGVFIVVN